jgi:hypothetical protein
MDDSAVAGGADRALTALQYINYINNKPIGRIKYALI